ncbi:MAG: glycosyltransferase [Alphaproteobacteria bacterium]|nr:glycosyltransferase [Alphaproteobacteria bacterium]
MKKVLFFLSDFQSGGTEWFALHLARGLKRLGYTPSFLVTRDFGELAPLIKNEFETYLLDGQGYGLLKIFRTVPAATRYIRQQRPDILISGLPILNAAAVIALGLARVPTKLIAVEHMRLIPDTSHGLKAALKYSVKKILTRFVHARAKRIVCVSQTVWRDIELATGFPRDKTILIHNPVVPENIEQLANDPPDSVLSGYISCGKPLILSIGRLLPVKDHKTLIRAFAIVRRSVDARLIILGEGDERDTLSTLIQELGLENDICLRGTVENIYPYLKHSKLLVLPSKQEAFGNVLVEALSCGVPVVSTDCGGPREILEKECFGRLVPVQDPAAMARAILETLETVCDREELIARGKLFSVTAAAHAYHDLIQSLEKD